VQGNRGGAKSSNKGESPAATSLKDRNYLASPSHNKKPEERIKKTHKAATPNAPTNNVARESLGLGAHLIIVQDHGIDKR